MQRETAPRKIADRFKYNLSNLTLLLILIPLLWGLGYPFIRASMSEIGAFQFLFFRFGIALIPLAFIFRRTLKQIDRSVWINGILMGMALATAYAALNLGLTFTSTAKAGFIIGVRVVLIPILLLIFYHTSISLPIWSAVITSTIGLGVFFIGMKSNLATINPGDVIMLISACAFAVHVILINRFSTQRHVGALIVIQVCVVTLVGGLLMIVFAGVTFPMDRITWFHLVGTGLLSTALAFWLQNRYQPLVSSEHAGIIFSSEPLFASLFGLLYLGEHLVGMQWIGGFLILSAMIIAQWSGIKSFFKRLRTRKIDSSKKRSRNDSI